MSAAEQIPTVSAGIPVFNGEQFLKGTIEALLNQSFRDIEVIISDNASTDGTEAICRAFAERDSRVRYHRNSTNVGPFTNYWRVFELSRGPYFKWNSANDLCSPDMVERCLKTLQDHPDAVLAYMKTRLVDDDLTALEEYDDRMSIQNDRPSDRFISYINNIELANALSGVIRSEALRQVRPFGQYRACDITLMGELVLVGKFVEIPEFGFMRRMGKETSTAHRGAEELRKFYFPGTRRQKRLVFWRLLSEHFRSVVRADIPMKEKLRLVYFVIGLFRWHRKILWHELVVYTGLSQDDVSALSQSTIDVSRRSGKKPMDGRVKGQLL